MKGASTGYVGYLLLAVGVYFSVMPWKAYSVFLSAALGLFTLLGLCISLRSQVLFPESSQKPTEPLSTSVYYQVLLALGQCGVVSLLLFFSHLLECQSELNPGIVPLGQGSILQELQTHPLRLGILPFLIFTIGGMALSYGCVVMQQKPFLFRLAFWARSKLNFFLHNLGHVIVEIMQIVWMALLWLIIFVWGAELISKMMHWDSIFKNPMKTSFILSLFLIFFRKTNLRYSEYVHRFRPSLALASSIYLLAFMVLFLWLHVTYDKIFPIKLQEIILQKEVVPALSSHEFTIRSHLLILGWWALWIPWMSSLVARATTKSPVLLVLLQSMIVPMCLFEGVLPKIDPEWFQLPWVQGMGYVLMLVWMGMIMQPIRSRLDLYKGKMPAEHNWSKKSLKDWFTKLLIFFSIFLLAWNFSGWIVLQTLLSLAAFFGIILFGLVTFSWAASLSREKALRKYKVQY